MKTFSLICIELAQAVANTISTSKTAQTVAANVERETSADASTKDPKKIYYEGVESSTKSEERYKVERKLNFLPIISRNTKSYDDIPLSPKDFSANFKKIDFLLDRRCGPQDVKCAWCTLGDIKLLAGCCHQSLNVYPFDSIVALEIIHELNFYHENDCRK